MPLLKIAHSSHCAGQLQLQPAKSLTTISAVFIFSSLWLGFCLVFELFFSSRNFFVTVRLTVAYNIIVGLKDIGHLEWCFICF